MTGPETWARRALTTLAGVEDRTFALLHRVEHRWRGRPIAADHGATTFDRRVLRTLAVALLCLAALSLVHDRNRRVKLLLLLLIALFLTFVILSLLDAFPRGTQRRRH